jgi:CTP synthase
LNSAYRPQLEAAGLIVSGASPDGRLVEIVELADHPWFLACQFHPEFKSSPFEPHPIFRSFIGAALRRRAQAGGPGAAAVSADPQTADVPGAGGGEPCADG